MEEIQSPVIPQTLTRNQMSMGRWHFFFVVEGVHKLDNSTNVHKWVVQVIAMDVELVNGAFAFVSKVGNFLEISDECQDGLVMHVRRTQVVYLFLLVSWSLGAITTTANQVTSGRGTSGSVTSGRVTSGASNSSSTVDPQTTVEDIQSTTSSTEENNKNIIWLYGAIGGSIGLLLIVLIVAGGLYGIFKFFQSIFCIYFFL